MEHVARWRARTSGLSPYGLDTFLAVCSAAVSLWSVYNDNVDWPWWVYLLAVSTSAFLPWRRRLGLWGLVLCSVPSLVMSGVAHSANPQVPLYVVIGMYTVADRFPDRQRWPVLAVVVVANVFGTHSPDGALFSVLVSGGSFVFGVLVRAQRVLAALQAERAREAGDRAASEAARAVAEERSRIAREMHDILAHAVSLMVIQAEAGPVVVHSDPDRAVRAFDTIADAGRDAMVQLRRVLGVLKEDGAAQALAPQPRLAELAEVAERVRGAGLSVDLELAEAPAGLTADVEAAAYRIVQEALTNTVKHSGADRAAIRVRCVGEVLEVVVSDNGRGVPMAADRKVAGWSGGRGLVGVRERAAACGGRAEAGPGPQGRGFVVSARLPLGAGVVREKVGG
ncbi:sensor histidine kinase [Streptomyces sp. NRRL WC-3742]|uniref:sensor histidine kinase n=1 Tax=Streptomyces sp. NRRL WC-3742 TaxID=1463934 RepID=UPI00055A3F18|nr:histidine kinase [Streptomyces sp. NRRL WC-3742]